LLAQPTVDARAVEALRQKMLAQHDQASQRWTQALLEISRVLTPEQRQQAAERLRQRLAMVQRHRAERESLEGAPR
jgi:Spy/CpxP family protein refolding chaperone